MSTATEEKLLRDICKELHGINMRLDRLIRSHIFSIEEPIVHVGIASEKDIWKNDSDPERVGW